MHQKNTMKLSDLPLAEKGVENFKVGQREQHYDSNKAKTYIFVIILLAAIIIISHGTVAPTSSAVISGGMFFRFLPHRGSRGTAAGNSIPGIVRVVDVECGIIGTHSVAENKIVKDRAAAKFSKGVKGVDVSRSEAGRARAIEHLCPEGDPLSKILKILGSKKRLFWTPEIRGVDPFSGFFG